MVSIIVPIFNRSHLIAETVRSVVNQTYSDWELLIVDDGSTDDVESVIRQFGDERIRYFRLEHSGMISKVRNFGLRHAVGGYIAFLDSDDLWEPHKLEFQLQLLSNYPEATFTFSHGEQFGAGAIPPPHLEALFVGDIFHAQLLEQRFVLYPTTFLFNRQVLQTVGYLDEGLSVDDIDFFFRMAFRYTGIFTSEKLARLRKHDGNISLKRELILCTDNILMYKKFLVQGLLTRSQYSLASSKQHYKLGLLFLYRHKPSEAVKSFIKYIQIKPFHYKGWMRLVHSLLKCLRF